ncbi:hypothetical protein D1007_57426 [Hordeum vulgare]|nr:hypothetical protein D1007_57426 [Hordeum vulgare]
MITPGVNGGLATTIADGGVAAMATNGGVAARTVTSHLRAVVAERVMATMADSGVAATTATSRLQVAVAERAISLTFDGGVVATTVDDGVVATTPSNSCRRAAVAECVRGYPSVPMALPVAPMALPAANKDNGAAIHHISRRGTHVRGKDLSVVYTNDPVLVESSIQTMEQLLAEDKYQVVRFDRSSPPVVTGKIRRFINSPDYNFAMVDTTSDLKVLDVSGLTYQNLVNSCDHDKA